jgi:monovalent cation:H+ antiporter-2, CPA2 family
MPHHTPLIATIVAGLVAAFVLGALAQRFRFSPLVGYLLAGVLVGPFTPGYVADQALAQELAELGVILLMFGVGLHFSLKDLLAVRAIAIPGAVGQIAVATLMGMALAHFLGWSLMGGFVFGLALSVASTVVLLRALQERRLVQTERGRIAVGWLIVEDLAMVLALVLLPALAGALGQEGGGDWRAWAGPLAITIGKVIAFVAFMLIVGRRVIPWVLHWTAHTGSRELFRLAVLAIALGVAFGAASLFGVSFALGAFFAGMILAESELSQRAAEETMPLRDAFAVLFFVSVGMLFNPLVIVRDPWPLLATAGIIILGKSLAAFAIVRAFRHDTKTALVIAASLAQIGEFSFILAGLGVELEILPQRGRDLILGGAIISIMLNPVIFGLLGRAAAKKAKADAPVPEVPDETAVTDLTEHVILVGYGRVGAAIAEGLETAERPFLVLEVDEISAKRAKLAGLEVVIGNAADPQVLALAGLPDAKLVIVAIPDGFEAGGVVQEARRTNPDVEIVARAHSDAEVEHLQHLGADRTVLGERELAEALLGQARAAGPVHGAVEPLPVAEGPPLTAASTAAKPRFTDAEWAILAGVRALDLGPGEAISKSALAAAAAPEADGAGLAAAIEALVRAGCLVDLGDDRISVSPDGASALAYAPVL